MDILIYWWNLNKSICTERVASAIFKVITNIARYFSPYSLQDQKGLYALRLVARDYGPRIVDLQSVDPPQPNE